MRVSLCLAALTLSFLGLTSCGPSSSVGQGGVSPSKVGINIQQNLIPRGRYGRHRTRYMSPRYITVHSTQNYSRGCGARWHSDLLRRGALKASKNSLGYLTWHYSVDDHSIWQSLPDREQGQHADYEGRGNRSSIGIEMCEDRGNSRSGTTDRTARLCAYLMKKHGIPLENIVPHQHWRMIRYADGRDLGHKRCPKFMISGGRLNSQWYAFKAKVARYHSRL